MPKRSQFLADLAGDNRQAALLVAQVGAAPTELQLITQVAEFDESVQGLRPIRSYIIRVLGVLEHQIVNFGVTSHDIQFSREHPLLYEYLTKPTAVFFRGAVSNVDALTLDIAQAHASTFGGWRHFPQYLNVEAPLQTLLSSGGGLLGQMPEPLAEKIIKVLEHHGLETKTAQGTAYISQHDNPALLQQRPEVLLFGASYFVAYAYAIDEFHGKQR